MQAGTHHAELLRLVQIGLALNSTLYTDQQHFARQIYRRKVKYGLVDGSSNCCLFSNLFDGTTSSCANAWNRIKLGGLATITRSSVYA